MSELIEKQWQLERTRISDPELLKEADDYFEFLKSQNFTGVFNKVSDALYFKGPGLSRSDICGLRSSCPKKFKYHTYDHPAESSKQCFIDGDFSHRYLFQPETTEKFIPESVVILKAYEEYGKQTASIRNTNAYKKVKAEYLDDGFQIVSSELYQETGKIVESLRNRYGNILSSGIAEKVAYGVDPATGLLVKIKPDFIHTENNIIRAIYDLKTTKDDPETFKRSIYKYGYHIQDAYYLRVIYLATGSYVSEFVFMCVEKVAPYLPYLVRCDEGYKALGKEFIDYALDTYKMCLTSGIWNGYQEMYEAEPPAYAISSDDY